MTKKVNKIFVIVFITLVFILFFSMLEGRIRFALTVITASTADYDKISINWENLYPYDHDITGFCCGNTDMDILHQESDDTKSDELTDCDKNYDDLISTKFIGIMSKLENLGTGWSTLMFNYKEIAQIAYVVNAKLTDQAGTQNVIILKNGYLVQAKKTKVNQNEACEILSGYYCLQKYLENEGIGFLFCFAPNKECALDNQLPSGAVSYANDNADTYIEAMEKLGINYIDLRKKLHEEGFEHYSLFFKTDHHWTIDGAFWATSVIENELNERFDLNIEDVNTFGTFSRKTYKNAMFGGSGQTVSRYYAQSEDFDMLFPDFENDFLLEIPDKNIYATGSFEDIFIDYGSLNNFMEQGGGYAYGTILYGNRPYVKITNLNNPDGPKILMIRDSFAIMAAPYLVFSCSEMILLDTREDDANFNGSVVNCIDGFKPDVVLALQYSPIRLKLNKDGI